MSAKVCPRCGAQYENLRSTTCPQCFAVLVAVDDATASELTAARAEVERSAEFQEARAADDERFRQQSFGGCLAACAIGLATLVLAVVLLATATRRHSPPARGAVAVQTARAEPLTTLPVAAAGIDDVLPPAAAPYARRSRDSDTALTGTLTRLWHGVYAAPDGKLLDVYALPAGLPTSEMNEFRLGVTLAGQVGGAARPTLFFATEYWRFAVLAAPGDSAAPAAFRDALAEHFGYTSGSKEGNRLP